MIKDNYNAICRGESVRANLIALKKALKDEKNIREFAYLLGGNFDVLAELLKHEDPKVRKNAALLLGKMESEDLIPLLFETYLSEETKFIRADYLKAISLMEYEELIPHLELQLETLRQQEASVEERKHVSEEIHTLQTMLQKYRKPEKHKFTGFYRKADVILVTNREQPEASGSQLPVGKYVKLKGGYRVKDIELAELLSIRTISEFLFPLEAGMLPADRPEFTGEEVTAGMMKLLDSMHAGNTPYRFRIELKSRADLSKKGSFIRKISDAIEQKSKGRLLNSKDDYEVELRLLERKDGTFLPMMKLYTIPDERFSYRKETIASSIQPVNAALTAELAKPYLKENAQVMDPFCGVGTMLIERAKAVPAGTMYGLDIYGEAVEKARTNTDISGCVVNYINRDFFTFEHEYLFDEIFTDMPQVTKMKTKEEIHTLYHQFFHKAPEHLVEDGILVLYTTEPQFAAEAVRRDPRWKMEKTYLLNEKNKTSVCIIRLRNH